MKYKMAPFLGDFLGPYSPKYCSISNNTNTVFEKFIKICILAQMGCTQSLQFWSILAPNLPQEKQKYC